MHNVSIYRIVLVVLIIGIILFNIIFMLLYSIGKLSEKKIRSDFCDVKCEGCIHKSNKYMISCFRLKYPFVFYYNFICICVIFIEGIIFFMDKYNMISLIISNTHIVDIILEMIIITIIITIIKIIEHIFKLNYKKQNANSESNSYENVDMSGDQSKNLQDIKEPEIDKNPVEDMVAPDKNNSK